MPQATTKAPQTPAPTPPVKTAPTATAMINGIPIPITQADVDNLLQRRSELSTQLNTASGRRNDLSRQLRTAQPGPDRTGIESRISQLDGRLVTIESEMEDVGRALRAAPQGLVQTTSTGVPTQPFGKLNSGQITGISIVFMVAVLMPLSLAFARYLQRLVSRPAPPQIPKDVNDRLERMEQGIEAVAVEIERIGEGQRFVTQLMGERAKQAALPEGVPRR